MLTPKRRVSDNSLKMKEIEMADNAILRVPDFFIELQMGRNPRDYGFAGVLETKRSKEYNFPHYYFYFDQGELYMDAFREKVFKACSKMDKRFDELKAKEVFLDFEVNGKDLSPKEWATRYEEYCRAPEFGIFKIPDEEEIRRKRINNPAYRAPFDAMIIRR